MKPQITEPKPDFDDDGGDGRGCLLLIGIICVGIGIGLLANNAWGWVVVGSLLILWVGLSGYGKKD